MSRAKTLIHRRQTHVLYRLADEILNKFHILGVAVRVQQVGDLLLGLDLSAEEHLQMQADANHRIASGERLYTVVRGDRLLIHGWLVLGKSACQPTPADPANASSMCAALVHGIHLVDSMEDNANLILHLCSKMLEDALLAGTAEFLVSIKREDRLVRQWLRKIGFVPVRRSCKAHPAER